MKLKFVTEIMALSYCQDLPEIRAWTNEFFPPI